MEPTADPTPLPPPPSAAAQVLLLTLGNVAAVAVLFLLDVALARFLSQLEFGLYKQTRLIYNLIGPFFTAALPFSILYFLPRYTSPAARQQFISQTALLLMLLGLLTGGALALSSRFLPALLDEAALARPLLWLSLYAAFDIGATFVTPTLITLHQTGRAALFLIGRALLLGLLTLAAVLLAPTATAATFGLAAASLLATLFAYFLTRHFLIPVRPDWAMLRGQLAYALPLGAASSIGRWAYQVDQVVVASLFTTASYAIYVVGAIEIPFITQLQNSISQVLLPNISGRLSSGQLGDTIGQWQRAMLRTAVLLFPLFALLQLVAADAIPFVFTERYLESIPIFRLYLLLIPLRIATFGLFLRASGRTQYDLLGIIGYLLLNAALSPLFALWLGLLGPPIATVLATLALIAFYLAATARHLHLPLSDLLPLRPLAFRFLLALLPAAVLLPLQPLLAPLPPLGRLAATTATYTLLYALALRTLAQPDYAYLLTTARHFIARLRP